MREFQGAAEANETVKLPQLGFGENAKVDHSVSEHYAISDLTGFDGNDRFVALVCCQKAVQQSQKSADQIALALGADTDSARGNMDAVIILSGIDHLYIANGEHILLGFRRDVESRGLMGEILPKFLDDPSVQTGMTDGVNTIGEHKLPFGFRNGLRMKDHMAAPSRFFTVYHEINIFETVFSIKKVDFLVIVCYDM